MRYIDFQSWTDLLNSSNFDQFQNKFIVFRPLDLRDLICVVLSSGYASIVLVPAPDFVSKRPTPLADRNLANLCLI